MQINEIYCGKSEKIMEKMPSEFVDLVVTSPPYDGLRTYNGYSFEFPLIANQLFRVIKRGGVVVWIVGDETKNGSESGTSFRQALYFKEIGFNLHDTMIYKKEIPTWNISCRRYRQHIEYMFVFSKGKVKTFNPIRDVKVKNMTPRLCKSNRNGNPHYELYTPKNEFTVRGNIWHYAVGSACTKDKIAYQHPAIFPEKLAQDHILSWSNEGDLVYDPFVGSGTVTKMAKVLRRNFIGSDISAEFCEIAKNRIENIS